MKAAEWLAVELLLWRGRFWFCGDGVRWFQIQREWARMVTVFERMGYRRGKCMLGTAVWGGTVKIWQEWEQFSVTMQDSTIGQCLMKLWSFETWWGTFYGPPVSLLYQHSMINALCRPFPLSMSTTCGCRLSLSASQKLGSIWSSRRSKMSNSLFTFSAGDFSACVPQLEQSTSDSECIYAAQKHLH